MPLPTHFQSTNRSLPPRVDSLKATKGPYFAEVEDELRDVRRVHAQGQEEDLRYALNRTITRIEELTSMLKEAYRAQTDLQTELTLARSNLQLALANNEMLEDALRRDPGSSRDVGWRRMSAREQSLKASAEADRRRSTDSLASAELSSSSPTFSHPSPAPEPSPMPLRSALAPSPAPTSEGRFFRFRFGNGSTSSASHPSSPRISGTQSPNLSGAHLTSASLPSLVSNKDYEKELEELQQQLEKERKAHKEASEAKAALEAEIESLSQALFEEANKMVATERRKLAETEEALREAREQGEALKNVLRLVERDARASTSSESSVPSEPTGPARSRHRATSSAVGIKSLPASGAASPSSRPSSPALPSSELPTSAATIVAKPSSPTPAEEEEEADGDKTMLAPTPSEFDGPGEAATLSETSKGSLSTTSHASPSSSPSRSPTPSPNPSPLSPPSQYLFGARPVDYLDGEESPWADATSSATITS
ncbi:hypothetical protein BN946_scf184585.g5 [Trametes cinnabarina]|uniref:GDP/GTP exchange factor Sec2 N-terminal domain-containing protein n=1 Tax=Pycnoporus cinnabarinus TaxID=5643 RepID=A0A060SMD8_PYCCI|nr:hypothetical protein BN946_scf184585.g5 [Trametes cinnabarina]